MEGSLVEGESSRESLSGGKKGGNMKKGREVAATRSREVFTTDVHIPNDP